MSTLNEFQARLYVAEAIGELQRGREFALPPGGGARQPGRQKAEEVDPQLGRELTRLVEDSTAGDPMNLLRWTSKSTRTLAAELTRRGHPIQSDTVARLLKKFDYRLQLNVKSKEGPQHRNRDRQFRYINRVAKAFRRRGDPVISVDAKKHELIGPFKNAGRTWRRRGQPEQVNVHDFRSLARGKGIPYGAYDELHNEAVVNVGITHETGEFAVESLRQWWKLAGRRRYPRAKRLLLCADAGGSNGYRLRAWKLHVQRFADQLRMPITVCHYPPGTSKWNKIEHRLFSFISLNWKGVPLVTYETVVNLIGGTRTRTGLKVYAKLDTHYYEKGVKVSKREMNEIRLCRHKLFPEWNYTVLPRPE